MGQTILFIDGENFHFKAEKVIPDVVLANLDIKKLIDIVLKETPPDKTNFYSAKLHEHAGTLKKSHGLIKLQRILKTKLEQQDIEFIMAGNVRGQKVGSKIVFHEKGVDVRIAVDMVSMAFEKKLTTAILCSSDSDLQPAVYKLKDQGINVVYLGFESNPNKGLIYTCDRTILIRNSELLLAYTPK